MYYINKNIHVWHDWYISQITKMPYFGITVGVFQRLISFSFRLSRFIHLGGLCPSYGFSLLWWTDFSWPCLSNCRMKFTPVIACFTRYGSLHIRYSFIATPNLRASVRHQTVSPVSYLFTATLVSYTWLCVSLLLQLIGHGLILWACCILNLGVSA